VAQKSKRKRSSGAKSSQPRAVASQRREQRAQKAAEIGRAEARQTLSSRPDKRGERPESPFGGLPVSELAIFIGGIAVIVGFITSKSAALIVGFVICALGVLEFTAREHFTGYRSHAMLLALFPAVVLEFVLAAIFGSGPSHRGVLIGAVVPVYAAVAWFLRQRYRLAHQRRAARPPRA
jgi:hypothetical protein